MLTYQKYRQKSTKVKHKYLPLSYTSIFRQKVFSYGIQTYMDMQYIHIHMHTYVERVKAYFETLTSNA